MMHLLLHKRLSRLGRKFIKIARKGMKRSICTRNLLLVHVLNRLTGRVAVERYTCVIGDRLHVHDGVRTRSLATVCALTEAAMYRRFMLTALFPHSLTVSPPTVVRFVWRMLVS
jgi:hypothetical protein